MKLKFTIALAILALLLPAFVQAEATLEEFTRYYKLSNDFDEWYVDKSGVQLSNDPSTPWARIWAGVGYKNKITDAWTEVLYDAVTWAWSTDSGTGWVKLIGDATFGPAGKLAVHCEWYLADGDKFLKITSRLDNDSRNFADSKFIVRNGQIRVNDNPIGNWYCIYNSDGSVHAEAELPIDASHNNLTENLKNEYKLWNNKYIWWKWDSTWDDNGTPATSDVDINISSANSKYGANGYTEHAFKMGAWSKGDYKETTHYWHDAETVYMASLMTFEMDGTDRQRQYGIEEFSNTAGSSRDYAFATAAESIYCANDFTTVGAFTLTAVRVYLKKQGTPTTTVLCEIRADDGGDPAVAVLATSTNSITSNDLDTSYAPIDFYFSGQALAAATNYWIVLKADGFDDVDNSPIVEDRDTNGYDIIRDGNLVAPYNGRAANRQFHTYLYASGNTIKQLCPQGITNPGDNFHTFKGIKHGTKIYGGGQTVTEIRYQRYKTDTDVSGNAVVGFQSHNAGSDIPSGSWVLSATEDSTTFGTSKEWSAALSVSSYTLVKDTIYWFVVDGTGITGSDDVETGNPYEAIHDDITGAWHLGYKSYNGSWSVFDYERTLAFLTNGTSDYGLLAPYCYYANNEDAFDYARLLGDVTPQIENDETTLYRTVLQIKALFDDWKRDMDAVDESYFISNNVGTWDGFDYISAPPNAKRFWCFAWGPGAYGDIFTEVTNPTAGGADQTSEWNGIDVNIPGTGVPPCISGQVENPLSGLSYEINCYKAATEHWEYQQTNTTDANYWCTYEFWFKVTDVFAVTDFPAVKGHWDGGGGGVALVGLRWTYDIVTEAAPPGGQIIMIMGEN